MRQALYLYGGWPGHKPYEVAEWARGLLQQEGYEVQETQDPFVFEDDLSRYDLIVIGWTQALTTEDLTDKQERGLLAAVAAGTGLAGWHGMAASFRSSLQYGFVMGGSFIEHPGGEGTPVPYQVTISDHIHPASAGVADFTVASEQYYMHVDPSVHVLAETTFSGEHLPWIEGIRMPVAYVKSWGKGRVFYCSVGHAPDDLKAPDVTQLVRQGLGWAGRI